MISSSATKFALTLVLSGAVALAAACGGSGPKVNYPKGDAGGIATDANGKQVGVVGTPDEKSGLSGSALAAYNSGFEAWMKGDLTAAKKGFQEAASQDPKSPAPDYSLGVVLEHLGDSAGAQQAFRSAFGKKPDYDLAMGGYALSLAGKGALSEADTFLSEKHAKMPNSARIAVYLAEVKSLAGDHGTAQQLGQDALRINADFKEAMVLLARDHYRARKMDLARYALQAVIDGFGEGSPPRDKENPEANLLRGLIEREIGRRSVALAAFEVAAKKRPSLVEAQVQLGAMKLEAGNAQEALEPLETAVKFGPTVALAHLNLGDCYRLLGRPGDAKKELEQSLALDSSLAQAHYNLGLLYLVSPNVPGFNPDSQMTASITEFEKYKTMRAKDVKDDADDLLNRAKAKQAELRAASAASAAASAPPPPPGPPPPAASGSASAAPAGTAAPAASGTAAAAPAATGTAAKK